MKLVLSSKNMQPLDKSHSIYEVGEYSLDVHTKVSGADFMLYHKGVSAPGAGGNHWSPSKDLVKDLQVSGTKVFSRLVSVKGWKRINDEIDYNNILWYMKDLKLDYSQVVSEVQSFYIQENCEYESITSLEKKWKGSTKKRFDMALQALHEVQNDNIYTTNSIRMLESINALMQKALKSIGVQGLVYYNNFEGGGDSFVTFERA